MNMACDSSLCMVLDILFCSRCSAKNVVCITCQDLARIQEKERKTKRDLVRMWDWHCCLLFDVQLHSLQLFHYLCYSPQ